MIGIFLIAAVKVRYVILDFMELRGAPIPVRIAFEAWPVGVAAVILGFWFATPRSHVTQLPACCHSAVPDPVDN
ncbi:hypothetical protein MPRG_63760 (plasmid) [Mycobacterium paragordonae]|uniref:Uncharacterized protein n=1 Tax=Mycobacterium paragordonae TaxID=1389713 RepID=A0ABQ1CF75_9MYCO|nr:cytochrome C oxidase subunit IV family protein [Mycobacterium paragordonae]GFG83100.1 hypothetical protein MPRG_63760 [Mycobacterium paragordonae]